MSDFFVAKKRGPRPRRKPRDNVIYLSDYRHPISDTGHGLKKQGPRSGAAAARKIVAARSTARSTAKGTAKSLAPLPPRLDQDRRVAVGPAWRAPSDVADFGLRSSRFATRIGAFLLFIPDWRHMLVLALVADEAPTTLWFLDAMPDGNFVGEDLFRVSPHKASQSPPGWHNRTAVTGDLQGIACPGGHLLGEPHDLRGRSRSRPQTGALPAHARRTLDLEGSPLRLRIAGPGDATRAIPAANDMTSILGYPARMLVENGVVDAARFSHIEARPSSAALGGAFDTPLLGVPSGLHRIMARRMRG